MTTFYDFNIEETPLSFLSLFQSAPISHRFPISAYSGRHNNRRDAF